MWDGHTDHFDRQQNHLSSQVYGLDADPQVLEIARFKANQAGANITLEQGLAYQLPFPEVLCLIVC